MADNRTLKMTAKRQLPRHLGVVIAAFDVAALFFSFWATKMLSGILVEIARFFEFETQFNHFDTRRFYYYFICGFIVLFFVYKGHYSRRLPWLGQVEGIVKTLGFAALFDGFNYYFLDYQSFPALMAFNWALCLCTLVLARQLSLRLVSQSRQWRLPVVLIGDSRMVMDAFYAFYSDGLTGYEVKTVLLTRDDGQDFDLSFLPAAHPYVELRRDGENFPHFIEENPNRYYIIGMDELGTSEKDPLNAALNRMQVEYAVLPNTKSLNIYKSEPHYFFGNDVMLLHRRDPIRSPSGRFVKRAIDICATILVLPALGLLTLCVWAIKEMEGSTTPVFYGGPRVGRHGRLFNCWKFCTMKENASDILNDILARDENARLEWEKYQKLKNDPRIDSSISAFLRKTSLDELPQLWNVFCGDMSLVGPRPYLPEQEADYGEMSELYKAVRPGLTGLWQVSGRNETSFQQRVYWDSWYIRNWTLWYDIVILFKTVRVFVTRSGAY